MPDMTVDVDLAAIRVAAQLLEDGGLVAFPTETVYGLGADAENPAAVARIYAAKGRPSNHPVIVHLAPEANLEDWAQAIPAHAHQLIAAFWPGPLTLILRRAASVPDAVSGGQDSIGLRCPSHPVAQALLRAFKHGRGGIAAPSANKFGHVSPTTAQHVRDEFAAATDDPVAYVLDGGQSAVGIESTILDLSRGYPVLLRPGHISATDIAAVIGIEPLAADTAAPRASGTLDAHYAPRTPVALIETAALTPTVVQLAAAGRRVALMHYSTTPSLHIAAQQALPDNPAGFAHDLYAALRTLDAADADVILVECPPLDAAWQGINDRLRRAAHYSVHILSRLLSPQ